MQTPESALQLWFLWWQLTTEPIKFGQTQTKSTGELHRGILLSERMKAGDEPSYLLGFLPADSLIGWPEVLNMPEWNLIWSPYSQAIKCSSPGCWAIICFPPLLSYYVLVLSFQLFLAMLLFFAVTVHSSLVLIPGSNALYPCSLSWPFCSQSLLKGQMTQVSQRTTSPFSEMVPKFFGWRPWDLLEFQALS